MLSLEATGIWSTSMKNRRLVWIPMLRLYHNCNLTSNPSSLVGCAASKRLKISLQFHWFLKIYILLDVIIQPFVYFYCIDHSNIV